MRTCRSFAPDRSTRYLFNSVVVAGATTVIVLLIGGLAGYALARLRFPGRRAIRWAILMVAMFPPIALVSPLFSLFDRLGVLDTYAALILPYTVFSLPLGTWILASYFAELPRDRGSSPGRWLFADAGALEGPAPPGRPRPRHGGDPGVYLCLE